MIQLNSQLGELLAVVGTLDPATLKNSERVSDAVDMSLFEEVVAILVLGDMAAETIDFRLESDSASGFATDKQTVKAATQLAADASLNDNAQLVLSARGQDMKAGHRYIRARAITGAGTGGLAGLVMLGVPKQNVASTKDLATVLQVLAA